MTKIKIDNAEIEVDKISSLKLDHLKDKEFIYFDKLPDGTWRMVYTEKSLPDFKP